MQVNNYQQLARNKFFELEKWLYKENVRKKSFGIIEHGIEHDGRELLRITLRITM